MQLKSQTLTGMSVLNLNFSPGPLTPSPNPRPYRPCILTVIIHTILTATIIIIITITTLVRIFCVFRQLNPRPMATCSKTR